MTDLEMAFAALVGKAARYSALFEYYDGDQPVVYSTERLRDAFRALNARLNQNWCQVVVNSELSRIRLESFTVNGDSALTEGLDGLLTATGLKYDLDEAHLAVLVTGESFVVVWPDAATGLPGAFYNDPRLCHVFYDNENPRVKRFAAKWWRDDDGLQRMTLYYPDRLEYYRSDKPLGGVSSASAFSLFTQVKNNPYGTIPVFRLALQRRVTKGVLENIIPIQDAINKLFADMMVSAEFGAFPQRYVISNVGVNGKLRNAPNEVWDIPGGDGMGQATSVGQFQATDLGSYLACIRDLAQTAGVISATPAHYFMASGTPPSGESLMVMEAPLTAKVQRRINQYFYPVWQEIGAFLLQVAGSPVAARDVVPVFGPVHAALPVTQSQVRQASVGAGMPLVTVLRDEGWTEKELEQMQQDRETEQAANEQGLGGALLAQQRKFDRGGQ